MTALFRFTKGEKRDRKDELKKKINSCSKNINDIVELGEIFVEEAKYKAALSLYRDALKLSINIVDKANVHLKMGIVLGELKEKSDACMNFEKSLSILKNFKDSVDLLEIKGLNYFYLSKLYTSRDKSDKACLEAIKKFEEIITKHPHYERILDILLLLEQLYSSLENYNKALEISKNALKLARDNEDKVECLHSIANVLRLRGEYKDSEKYYRQALAHGKANKSLLPEIYYGLGLLYEEIGNNENAETSFERALEGRKFNTTLKNSLDYLIEIKWHLGKLSYERQKYKKAIKHFNCAVENISDSYPEFCNIQSWLGNSYYEVEDYKKAKIAYEAILNYKDATAEEIINAISYIANIYSQLKNYTKAVEKYEHLLNISNEHRKDPIVLYNLGIGYTNINKKIKAIKYFEKIISKNLSTPLREEVLYRISVLYIEQKQFEEFEEYLDMLIKEFPNSKLTKELKDYRKQFMENKGTDMA